MDRPLTQDLRPGETLDRAAYERAGGYQALRRVLRELTGEQVMEQVKQSNLRGRGGAGFATGMKWSFVPRGPDAPRPKYFVVNADEMEPGTFKDRLLMEGNPHLLIEGLILCAYGIEAEEAYIFLRWEYRRSEEALRGALAEAYQAGYLGQDILGSGFSLEAHLHLSAGRYMCGEETALLNALEGKRAVPRSKPPFPQICGLWGKPTIVQNVETVCNVPPLLARGVEWFRSLSRTENGGTKIYGVSGRVKRPGLWELPLGTPLREILEEHAGGMLPGFHFRGALPGGASTDFVLPEHLDVPMDFGPLMATGSRLGTGTVVVLDDQTCPVGLVLNLTEFFARESCGWCTPCREGLPWVAQTLAALEEGHGQSEDLQILGDHAARLAPGHTFCALAPGAAEPLQSSLRYFSEDYQRHLSEGRCPWRPR